MSTQIKKLPLTDAVERLRRGIHATDRDGEGVKPHPVSNETRIRLAIKASPEEALEHQSGEDKAVIKLPVDACLMLDQDRRRAVWSGRLEAENKQIKFISTEQPQREDDLRTPSFLATYEEARPHVRAPYNCAAYLQRAGDFYYLLIICRSDDSSADLDVIGAYYKTDVPLMFSRLPSNWKSGVDAVFVDSFKQGQTIFKYNKKLKYLCPTGDIEASSGLDFNHSACDDMALLHDYSWDIDLFQAVSDFDSLPDYWGAELAPEDAWALYKKYEVGGMSANQPCREFFVSEEDLYKDGLTTFLSTDADEEFSWRRVADMDSPVVQTFKSCVERRMLNTGSEGFSNEIGNWPSAESAESAFEFLMESSKSVKWFAADLAQHKVIMLHDVPLMMDKLLGKDCPSGDHYLVCAKDCVIESDGLTYLPSMTADDAKSKFAFSRDLDQLISAEHREHRRGYRYNKSEQTA